MKYKKRYWLKLRGNPKITAKILSEMLGIAERNVKNHIMTVAVPCVAGCMGLLPICFICQYKGELCILRFFHHYLSLRSFAPSTVARLMPTLSFSAIVAYL
jgi:hypothetical protein